MYVMKRIVDHDDKIELPKCMYHIKNPIDLTEEDEICLKINEKVLKFIKGPNNKMTELETRQDELLNKLEILYERIKTISSQCKLDNMSANIQSSNASKVESVITPEEVVLVLSPDSLPWYLNIILKKSNIPIHTTCHVHSSVPSEKLAKIKAFTQKLKTSENPKVNLRLIFKAAADSELKLSALSTPILGNVNILRYLSLAYPTIIPYDHNDHIVDNLLDICHVLERTSEKNKEAVVNRLFAHFKTWIYGDKFSVVDLAAYNLIKQWRNTPKFVSKVWFDKCEKLCS